MSAPTAELAAAAEPERAEQRAAAAPFERPLGVLGIAIGLAAIAWFVYTLARPGARAIDARAALEESFEIGALPFGLEITSASIGTGEERVIVLENRAAEPEPPLATPPAASQSAADGAPKKPWWKIFGGGPEPAPDMNAPKKDWTKVPLGPSGRAPVKAYLTLFPRRGGGDLVRARFGGMGWGGVRDLGPQGGLAVVEVGKLEWGEYEPDYVHERLYEVGDTFRDSVRVNVSAPGRHGILSVLWPRGSRGSKESVERLLAALRPKIAAEADAER